MTCPGCAREFKPEHHRQRFHSRRCRELQRDAKKRHWTPQIRGCRACSQPFTQHRYNQEMCSPACSRVIRLEQNKATNRRREEQTERNRIAKGAFAWRTVPTTAGNPTKCRGGERRNCARYSDCLSVAVYRNWLGFDCSQCKSCVPPKSIRIEIKSSMIRCAES